MSRVLTTRNLYSKKFEFIPFIGMWLTVFGNQTCRGAWLIWGAEKNGKTWFALILANLLSKFGKVLYISAEEGTDDAFVASCKRAGIEDTNKNINYDEYLTIDELEHKLKARRSPDFVFIDNLTIYSDDFRNGVLKELIKKHDNKLFVFIAHEDRNEPYTASAKLCRKLAKVIVHVKGLACSVSGRCPGGVLTIDEEKAMVFHGMKALGNDKCLTIND
jgi:hypothetical protein